MTGWQGVGERGGGQLGVRGCGVRVWDGVGERDRERWRGVGSEGCGGG